MVEHPVVDRVHQRFVLGQTPGHGERRGDAFLLNDADGEVLGGGDVHSVLFQGALRHAGGFFSRVADRRGRARAGEVESVSNREITLWTERRWQLDDIPRRGDLVLDTTVGRIPVQRQLDALATTRFGRARRPELRNILIDPIKALEPLPIPDRFCNWWTDL